MYVVTIVRSHFANFEFTVSGGTWPGDLKSHQSKTDETATKIAVAQI